MIELLQNQLTAETIEEMVHTDYEELMTCARCQLTSCEDINCPFKQSNTD